MSKRPDPITHPVAAAVLVGSGGMARHHVRQMISQGDAVPFKLVCEPSAKSYADFCTVFTEAGLTPPANVPNLADLLAAHAHELDAAFIITPHVLHFGQAKMCLEAGLDVLLEKPMVMSADEAANLIDVRDRTGRLLVVAFNGSLSPHVREAVRILRSGELGRILNIHGVIWQNWQPNTTGTWRQMPELSGGGFMFDTGAHLLNTVADLAGEEFVEVAAWLDNRGIARGHCGHGHGPAALGRAGHPERMRQHHPLVRIGYPGLLHGRHPAHGGLGPGSGCAAGWRGEVAVPSLWPPTGGCGTSLWTCAADASPTPLRRKWACAWPGCGMPCRPPQRTAGGL